MQHLNLLQQPIDFCQILDRCLVCPHTCSRLAMQQIYSCRIGFACVDHPLWSERRTGARVVIKRSIKLCPLKYMKFFMCPLALRHRLLYEGQPPARLIHQIDL